MQSNATDRGDGLPDTRLVRGAGFALVAALLVGIYLLIATPTLSHERERTSAAPPPAGVNRGGARPGAQPAPSPASAVGTVAPTAVPTTPAAAAATPTQAPPPVGRYMIRPGDTLLAIADQHDTTVDALRAANPGLSETALPVGQEITIPPNR